MSPPVSQVPPSGQAVLNVSEINPLGRVVSDAAGLTLYRFDMDTANPPRSRCTGECARQWPPLLAQGEMTVRGIDKNLVGTLQRPDGTQQVTLAGWPLYRYADDLYPGEFQGQGKENAWFAGTPDGKKAIEADDSPDVYATGSAAATSADGS